MGLKSYLNAALRDEWDGLERISRDIRPADLVTMANAITGLFATWYAAQGDLRTGALLILAGILLDGLDGAVARIGGGGGPLGGFLDALSDTVTFGVAPAALLLGGGWPPAVVAGFLLACVLLRLARFEALRERKDNRYFSGLSSPGGALLVAAGTLMALEASIVLASAVVAGFLMISRIRYPKLRGWLGVVASLLILAVLADVWIAIPYAVEAMVAFMAVYVLTGPFYVLARIGPTKVS